LLPREQKKNELIPILGWEIEAALKAPVPVAAPADPVREAEPAPTPAGSMSSAATAPAPLESPAESPAESVAVAPSAAPVEVPSDSPAPPPAESSPAEQADIDADLAITLGRPKTTAAPTGNLAALLGGKSMLVEVEEKKEAEGMALSDTSHLNGAYDEAAVRAAWAALSEHLRGQNKVGLAATLLGGELAFDDPLIRFTVANEVQAEEMKECAADLLHFVRTTVGSGRIALEVSVSEVEAAPAFLTPKDRYMKWAGENPALEVLRKRLDLDIG